MKKTITIIIIIILLLVIGIWSPWFHWNLSIGKLIGLGSKESTSGLQVYSLLGEMEVYLDNQYQGIANPDNGELGIFDIKPGLHEIKLKRKSQPDDAYYELTRKINFENGLDVIISYELGPSIKFSEGHILYAEKKVAGNDNAKLNIISSPDQASLYIDDTYIGETPLSGIETDLSKQLNIKLIKDGYDTIEFKILPESQEDRDKLKGYTLNLEINMFLLPISIEDQNGEG